MSSLLHDLTDIGIAVNPEVSTLADISGQSKTKQDLDANFITAKLFIFINFETTFLDMSHYLTCYENKFLL